MRGADTTMAAIRNRYDALVIGGIVIAMYLPMFSLISKIG